MSENSWGGRQEGRQTRTGKWRENIVREEEVRREQDTQTQGGKRNVEGNN